MAGTAELAPWRPGDNIRETTAIADVMNVLAFGQGDEVYAKIAQKLSDRGCKLVEDLRNAWTRSELLSTIRSLSGLKKTPHAYVAGMLNALRIELEGAELGFKTEEKSKGFSGGDMMDRSQKIKPPPGFIPTKYDFDGAFYNYLPAKGVCEHLDDEEEKLLLDLVLLYMNADPEACLGTYLPEGLPGQLAKLHRARLPPFKPKKSTGVAGCETELSLKEMAKKYKDRIQNARNHTYKRMKLDQSYAEHFSEQIARHLIFVPADDDSLVDNVRNEAFAKFLGIFQGTITRTKVVDSPSLPPQLPFMGAAAAATPRAAATADAATPATADTAEAADADADEGDSAEGTGLVTTECTALVATECAAEDDSAMEALDGLSLGNAARSSAPAPPRVKTVSREAPAAAASAATKRAQTAQKRSAAREPPGRPPAKKQLMREPDSSDEDDADSSEDEEASSAAAAPAKAPTRRRPPAKKAAAKPPSALALPSLSFAPPSPTAHASTARASAIGNSLSPEMSPAPTSPITPHPLPHTAGSY